MAAPTVTTRLLAVRHGRSEWNAAGRWQGHADIALDHTGELQAVAATEVLGGFDAIWSSDLRRAHRTAQIIAELLGVGPVHTDPRLREKDVGPWEGLTNAEVERRWPGMLATRDRPAGFETDDAAGARFCAALADLASTHPGGEVLIVSHGGVVRAAQRRLGADPPHLPNLSGCWFEHRTWPDRERDELIAGDTVHLLVDDGRGSVVL
ncbi:MAG: histidine phosphatase family protein [Acidimicrobiales bacterium]|nr:histidine phosphatase family protein [Acidimicrobiales bacterium]MCB9392645.1 histidine phosphatase family protein [Acidimicrobiaceae bacterium]